MAAAADGAKKLYELRLYQPYPGRMPDLLRRFREQVPALFARHGIARCGAWLTTVVDGPAQLVYLTAHAGSAQRDAAWAAFGADPQWQAVRRDSNAGAEMLQGYELHLLKPRAGIDLPARPAGEVRELIFLPTRHGQEVQVTEWLRNTLMPQLQATGASLAFCGDVTSGVGLPQLVLMIACQGEPTQLQRDAVNSIALPADLAPLKSLVDILRRIALDPV